MSTGQMMTVSASHVGRQSKQLSRVGRRKPAVTMAVSTAPDSTESAASTGDDLIAWMKSQGMPDCKVVLKDRSGGAAGDEPMHYVAAAVDLQVRRLIASFRCSRMLFRDEEGTSHCSQLRGRCKFLHSLQTLSLIAPVNETAATRC